MHNDHNSAPRTFDGNPPEKLLTLQQAADLLGIPIWKVRRAAKSGVFATYHVANSRALVNLSEVVATIEASKVGGDNDVTF